jgi:hypothetical protein
MQLFSCTYTHTHTIGIVPFPVSIYPPVDLHVLNHRVKEEKRKESNAACGLVIQVFNTLSTWGKGGRGKGKEKGKE